MMIQQFETQGAFESEVTYSRRTSFGNFVLEQGLTLMAKTDVEAEECPLMER